MTAGGKAGILFDFIQKIWNPFAIVRRMTITARPFPDRRMDAIRLCNIRLGGSLVNGVGPVHFIMAEGTKSGIDIRHA